LDALLKTAKHVDAAVAYFGQGGANMLPLRKGHRLVVDMSARTVRSGATDPREIEKLMRRGVLAFTRHNLHAKLIVADKSVLCGSANISKNSQRFLDEAAIFTKDPATLRRAREFIEQICVEPIGPEYLAECKRLYKPPCFNRERVSGKHQQRARHAKLWIVNLREQPLPDSETECYERGKAKAKKKMRDDTRCTIEDFYWGHRPSMASELEFGDWVIQVITNKDESIDVYPPGQLLVIDNYVRDSVSGKRRWVFHLEVPRRGQTMNWKSFRRAARAILGAGALTAPRTRSIRDVQVADGLLRLWTANGKVARR
jgi:hypothetical protein